MLCWIGCIICKEMTDSATNADNIDDTPTEPMSDDESHVSSQHPPRRFGIVKYYNFRRGEQYGFISDLGIVGTNEPTIEDRVYFHRTAIRLQGSSSVVLVQMPTNTIVEYVLETHISGGNPSYRAVDITNLNELELPCQLGIVTFTPYHVAMKKMTKNQVAQGQSHFEKLVENMDGSDSTSQSKDALFSNWTDE